MNTNKFNAINWNNCPEFDLLIWEQNKRNIWFDTEIPLSDDKNTWARMNYNEQDTYKKVLGGLTLLDTQQSLVGMPRIMFECNDLFQKSIMTFMSMMETVHAKSYSSIFSTLCTTTEIKEIFDWTETNIYLVEKMRIILDVYNNIPKYSLSTAMATSVMLESFLFYSGFFYPLYLAANGKLTNSNEIINLIIRDECLDENTELLTPNGWIFINKITKNDKVAQYNEDGSIEFVNPIQISSHINDIAYELKSHQGHIDQLVSPEHRIVIKNKEKLKVVKAKDLEKKHFNYGNNFIHAGLKVSGKIDKLSAKDRLLIAIQAYGSINNELRPDGTFVRDGSRSGYFIAGFGLKKKRKIDRLLSIISELNLEFKEHSKPGDGYRGFYIYIPKDWPRDKRLHSIINLEDITFNYAREFIEEISYWDGHIYMNYEEETYVSTIKENTYFIQAIASLAGYKSLVGKGIDNIKETYSDSYRIHIDKRISTSDAQKVKLNKLSGEFTFYGVEVPSGYLLTKRNKCTIVTGNSVHGVYIGNIAQRQNDYDEKLIRQIFNDLMTIEFEYCEYLYNDLNLVNDAKSFVKYNANKAFMNLGLDVPFPTLKESDINPMVIKGLNTETKNHDFFSTKGNGYIRGTVEKTNDEDFDF